MASTENSLSRSDSSRSDDDFDVADVISLYQNLFSFGGLVWLAWRNKVGFKGKVMLFICKTAINYAETALGLLGLYLIYFRPYAIRPHVDSATLATFDLAPGRTSYVNDTLHYDLALNVTFWSDHRIWAIRYNHFTARLFFNGTQMSPPDDTISKFKGRTRRHRTVHPLLRGRASNVSATVAEEFSLQRAEGWFAVEVRLRAKLTYLIWPIRHHYYYEYDCWLHFPSSVTATPAVTEGVKCSKGKRFGLS